MDAELLDRLWNEVINLDPQGRWIEQAARATVPSAAPFSDVAAVLNRLTAAGASPEDLGRIGRAERYEACFSTVYALDDPGPGRRKLSALSAVAEKAAVPTVGPRGRTDEFTTELKRIMGVDEEADPEVEAADLEDRINRCQRDPQAPFADVGASLQRVAQCGATSADFTRLGSWHRSEACRLTLKLAGEAGFDSAEDVASLYESLLTADPSGKDGRPGSWPVPTPEPSRRSAGQEDPTKPFLAIKRGDCSFAFTPDSTGMMVGNELLDADTGEVRLTCEAKGALRAWEFSPDGARIYYAVGDNGFTVCDMRTGKQILKERRRNAGTLQWFLIHPKTGELLVQEIRKLEDSTRQGFSTFAPPSYTLLDPLRLEGKRMLNLTPGSSMAKHFAFSPDGLHLAAFWEQPPGGPRPVPGTRVTVWRWPEATEEWDVLTACRLEWSIAWSSDSRRIAVGHEEVIVLDAETGAEQLRFKPVKDCNHVVFSPDGEYIVTGAHSADRIQIWAASTARVVREVPLPKPWCFGISFTPNGKVLGVASHRMNCFWHVASLFDG